MPLEFQYRPETVRKLKTLFPNDEELHRLLDTNDKHVHSHLFIIKQELSDLMYEVFASHSKKDQNPQQWVSKRNMG